MCEIACVNVILDNQICDTTHLHMRIPRDTPFFDYFFWVSLQVRLMAYNMELLLLILVILEDYNPDIAQVIRVFLPPTKIKDDVLSRDCLPRAKSLTLQIMKSLYLKDDSAKPHPLLGEALWDMITFLVDELKSAPVDSFSRYVVNEPFALPELLCHFWAPMLTAAFKDRHLMLNLSEVHSSRAVSEEARAHTHTLSLTHSRKLAHTHTHAHTHAGCAVGSPGVYFE